MHDLERLLWSAPNKMTGNVISVVQKHSEPVWYVLKSEAPVMTVASFAEGVMSHTFSV